VHLTFETVSCDLCGSDRQEKVISGHDQLTGLPGTFQFVRCLDCGLIRQNPRLVPSALDLYYPESYPSFALSVHMYIFSQQTIEGFLQKTGFNLKAVRSLFSEYRVFRMSFESWVSERISSDKVRRAIGMLLHSLPVQLMGGLALRIAVPAPRNSVLVFVCQKG